MKIAIIIILQVSCCLFWGYTINVKNTQINHLESELRSVRYHYLKCSTALLDSSLHAKCFKLGE